MTSDDLSAIAAIALGALVAVTATVTFIDSDPPPAPADRIVVFESGWNPAAALPISPSPFVDFALLRPGDFSRDPIFVPEGPQSGWRLMQRVGPSSGWQPMERLERPR